MVNDEGLEDEGMQDPVVLRGLLQCIAIAFFFSGRYLLDVLFTPHAVQAVPQQLLALAHRAWTAAWCAPAMSLVLLHYWGSLEYGLFSLLDQANFSWSAISTSGGHRGKSASSHVLAPDSVPGCDVDA